MALAGGVVSVCAAAMVGNALGAQRIGMLISYAIGALLGAAFLEILPHALEHGDPHRMAATVLFGILLFFVLEKLVLWRHCHHDHCEAHEAQAPAHDHGRSGLLIMVGDTFHNFVDGILIAAAFLESTELGIVTALAIVAHEIPQEVGDYLILLHSGYSKARALAFNLLSSLATLVGALLAYLALSEFDGMDSDAARAGRGEHDLRRGRRPDSGAAQTDGTAGDATADTTDRPGCRVDRRRARAGRRVNAGAGGAP